MSNILQVPIRDWLYPILYEYRNRNITVCSVPTSNKTASHVFRHIITLAHVPKTPLLTNFPHLARTAQLLSLFFTRARFLHFRVSYRALVL